MHVKKDISKKCYTFLGTEGTTPNAADGSISPSSAESVLAAVSMPDPPMMIVRGSDGCQDGKVRGGRTGSGK